MLIKPMFAMFTDTWQSYVYTYCTKTALKMFLKRTITQTNF